MTKLFNRVFASVPEDVKSDEELFEKMSLLQQFVRPENLDIKPEYQNETSWLVWKITSLVFRAFFLLDVLHRWQAALMKKFLSETELRLHCTCLGLGWSSGRFYVIYLYTLHTTICMPLCSCITLPSWIFAVQFLITASHSAIHSSSS